MESSGSLAGPAQLPSTHVTDQSINRRFTKDTNSSHAHSSHPKSSHQYTNSPVERTRPQHPALQNLPLTVKRSHHSSNEARDRAAPYLVPIKPKPSPAFSGSSGGLVQQYEMPVVIPKPTSLSYRMDPDVQIIQDDENAAEESAEMEETAPVKAATVQYVSLSQPDRAALDRQNKESTRFFSDCRDFFTFLQGIVV